VSLPYSSTELRYTSYRRRDGRATAVSGVRRGFKRLLALKSDSRQVAAA
jgi:hypothetical protein